MPKKTSRILKSVVKRAKGVAKKGAKGILKTGKRAMIAAGVPSSMIKFVSDVGKDLSIFGDQKHSSTKLRPQAVASSRVSTNPTWTEVVGKVVSQFAGQSATGIKIRGRQPCVLVYRPAGVPGSVFVSDMALALPDGLDTVLAIQPSLLGGPLAVQASQYQMYVMRKMIFEFDTTTASTTTGQFCMAYCREPLLASTGADNIPSTFAENRATTPSVVVTYRSEAANLEVTYDGQQLFYLDSASGGSSPEAARQSVQGQVRCYADGVFSESQVMGTLNMTYEVDLFFPTINASMVFASRYFSGLSHAELEVLRGVARKLRSERKSKTELRGLAASCDAVADIEDQEILGHPGPYGGPVVAARSSSRR